MDIDAIPDLLFIQQKLCLRRSGMTEVEKATVSVLRNAQLLLNKQQQIWSAVCIHWHFSISTDTVVLPNNSFSLFLKVCRDGAEVMWSRSLFQIRETALGNAQSPIVDSWVGSTIFADVDDDCSLCFELMFGYISEVCHRDILVQVALRVKKIRCAAAFKTDCSLLNI